MRKFLALLLLVAVVYADGSFSPQFPGVLNYQYTVNYTISGSSITVILSSHLIQTSKLLNKPTSSQVDSATLHLYG